jgi:hypothetical protein
VFLGKEEKIASGRIADGARGALKAPGSDPGACGGAFQVAAWFETCCCGGGGC